MQSITYDERSPRSGIPPELEQWNAGVFHTPVFLLSGICNANHREGDKKMRPNSPSEKFLIPHCFSGIDKNITGLYDPKKIVGEHKRTIYIQEINMIKKRGLAGLIIFSIITFGIYGLYWIHSLAKDVNTICEGDGKKTSGLLMYFLLSIITLGIYSLVWLYMLGDRLQDNAPKYNLTFKESGGTVLLWYIFGSIIVVGPFISLHIIIKNTNALADEYNKRIIPQT
jgi:hypothetical protein